MNQSTVTKQTKEFWQKAERVCVVRMTKELPRIPQSCAHVFYGIRSGKPYRLAGSYPEKVAALIDAGVRLDHALCFLDLVRQHCVTIKLTKAPLTIEEALLDEADAEHEVDMATLRLAAHPKDRACIEACEEAFNRLEYSLEIGKATLAMQRMQA